MKEKAVGGSNTKQIYKTLHQLCLRSRRPGCVGCTLCCNLVTSRAPGTRGQQGSRARPHSALPHLEMLLHPGSFGSERTQDTRPSLRGSARRQELQPSPRAALGQQRAPHIPWPSAQPQPCSAGRCRSWAGHTASPAFLCKTSKNTYFCKIMFLYVELCKYTRLSGEKKTHCGPAWEGGGAVHIT